MNRFVLIVFVGILSLTTFAQDVVNGNAIIATAKQYLGCPYVYGAVGPSTFDCSGFVGFFYRKNGVQLPRTSGEMSRQGKQVDGSWDQLRAGDLVFFGKGRISHVGIYVGKNNSGKNEFIHASCSKGITISALQEHYWKSIFRFGRRLSMVEVAMNPVEEDVIIVQNPEETFVTYEAQESLPVPETNAVNIVKSAEPIIEVGSGAILPTYEVGSGAVTASKDWKIRVNNKARKRVTFEQ